MFFAYRLWLGPCAVVSAAILIAPSSDQLQAFINRFPADWRLPSWGQYGCGLRIGEVLALNVNQFLDGGQAYRVKEQVNPGGKIIPCKWRDEGEFRDVPVPKFVQQRYREHVALFPLDRGGYVIPGRKRPRVVRNSYLQHFRAAVEVADLPDFMASHFLRHRWASVMLGRGIDITHVSRWLGHRQIQTTYAIYGHMMPSVADDARKVMDDGFQASGEAGQPALPSVARATAEATAVRERPGEDGGTRQLSSPARSPQLPVLRSITSSLLML